MSTTPIDNTTTLKDARVAEGPSVGKVAVSFPKNGLPSEQFVALASRIMSLRGEVGSSKSVGVTSCHASEGVTTVATQLAMALAAATDGRVVLVELPNLISPGRSAHRRSPTGWTELLTGDVDIEDAVQTTDAPGVSRISTGNVSQMGLIGMDVHRLASVTRQLKQQFEFVVVDLPPVHELTGCLPMASVLDGVLMVVQPGRNDAKQALRAKLELDQAGARIVGVVLNKSRLYAPRFLYFLFPFLKPR